MVPTFYIPIGGTWSWNKDEKLDWWERDSLFCKFMHSERAVQYLPECPFEWSTDLDGLFGDHRQWKTSAKSLRYYLDHPLCPVPSTARNVIAHSHAMQVVLYYAANGGHIRNLITIGSPVRQDLRAEAELARKNIDNWLHIRDKKWDIIGFLGQLGDKRISLDRDNPWADDEDTLDGISHSKILHHPELFNLWKERKWLEFLAYGTRTKFNGK